MVSAVIFDLVESDCSIILTLYGIYYYPFILFNISHITYYMIKMKYLLKIYSTLMFSFLYDIL